MPFLLLPMRSPLFLLYPLRNGLCCFLFVYFPWRFRLAKQCLVLFYGCFSRGPSRPSDPLPIHSYSDLFHLGLSGIFTFFERVLGKNAAVPRTFRGGIFLSEEASLFESPLKPYVIVRAHTKGTGYWDITLSICYNSHPRNGAPFILFMRTEE